jgi:hypothetical protein
MNIKSAVICILLVVSAANISLAKDPRGSSFSNDAALLLQHDGVRKELNLNDNQKNEAIKLADKAKADGDDLIRLGLTSAKEFQDRANDLTEQHKKALEKMLQPQQLQRLNEVSLQVSMRYDWNATLINRLSEKLSLTGDQKTKLLELKKEQPRAYKDKMNELKMNDPNRAQTLRALNNQQRATSLGILTKEQTQTLGELEGNEFDMKLLISFTLTVPGAK